MLLALCAATIVFSQEFRLANLDLSQISQDWGTPQVDRSVGGNPLTIGGKVFEHGLGTHAKSSFKIDLGKRGDRFRAEVGVVDEVAGSIASIEFMLVGDGKSIFQSGIMHAGDAARAVNVSIAGMKTIELIVSDGGDGNGWDHADWADGTITMKSGTPKSVVLPKEKAVILTPKPARMPRITGPRIFGARPGHPILFTFTATGDKPIAFSASDLPAGVSLDSKTGMLSGSAARGRYPFEIMAKNRRGSASRNFTLVIGDEIALTPPLGWNSWNCFAGDVDDEKVRAAAKAMVDSGLADHGWSYINIDDCWSIAAPGQGRDADGNILCNKKFPDMRALTDYIHGLGLKAGIYTSPGPLTCAGFTAAYGHEDADAKQFAAWGFDYLKYDWCSYGNIAKDDSLPEYQKPYAVMRKSLDKVDRDIVYSLCQYGMGEVWKWGEKIGGDCWRTTGDITDTWASMSGIGFSQDGHDIYAKPGNWNDPDMLVLGYVGWGPQLHPTRLTPNEQYTHVSLWCLLAAPLLIGADMTKLDPFTLSLLTNDEVIDVNQDPMGRQGRRVAQKDGCEVWAKPLEDGSFAVGLFNLNETPKTVTVSWDDLVIPLDAKVRDLWRQKDLGTFNREFSSKVPRHGVRLIKVTPS
jgi:alpha-galactosidase